MRRSIYDVMGRIFARLLKLDGSFTVSTYLDGIKQNMTETFARLYILLLKERLIDKDTQTYLTYYLDMINVDDIPSVPLSEEEYNKFYYSFMSEYNRLVDTDILRKSPLTQQEMADIAGVTRQTIWRWVDLQKMPIKSYLAIEDAIWSKWQTVDKSY